MRLVLIDRYDKVTESLRRKRNENDLPCCDWLTAQLFFSSANHSREYRFRFVFVSFSFRFRFVFVSVSSQTFRHFVIPIEAELKAWSMYSIIYMFCTQ